MQLDEQPLEETAAVVRRREEARLAPAQLSLLDRLVDSKQASRYTTATLPLHYRYTTVTLVDSKQASEQASK